MCWADPINNVGALADKLEDILTVELYTISLNEALENLKNDYSGDDFKKMLVIFSFLKCIYCYYYGFKMFSNLFYIFLQWPWSNSCWELFF